MESDISPAFQEELRCFICLSCLTDPVTTSCGHSFCRACLHLSWEVTPLPVHCPACRKPSQQKDFRTNLVLKKLVSIAKQASLRKDLSSEEQKCGTHGETRRIFCAENRIYLCQLCSDSHDTDHRHCPVEVAAEGQVERLLKQMARVWEKIRENEANREAANRTETLWMGYLSRREDLIRTEYRELHRVHSEEEEQHIKSMKKEGRRGLRKLRKSKAMMVQKSKELKEMYLELMEMSQEPYMVLLQDSEDILGRSESKQLDMPQTVKPELCALPITGLTEKFNCFQAHINFTNTAVFHSNENLYNFLRRFSLRLQSKDTSVGCARSHLVSWASQSFMSGKYYWEQDLGDSSEWAVGVSMDPFIRHRNDLIERYGTFLLVCVKEGNHYNLLTTCPLFHHFIEKPLGKVGVLFDCEAGCLGFLNVAQSSLIHRYHPGTFNYPVRPFFSVSHHEHSYM